MLLNLQYGRLLYKNKLSCKFIKTVFYLFTLILKGALLWLIYNLCYRVRFQTTQSQWLLFIATYKNMKMCSANFKLQLECRCRYGVCWIKFNWNKQYLINRGFQTTGNTAHPCWFHMYCVCNPKERCGMKNEEYF